MHLLYAIDILYEPKSLLAFNWDSFQSRSSLSSANSMYVPRYYATPRPFLQSLARLSKAKAEQAVIIVMVETHP